MANVKVFRDGDGWIALLGENLQVGIAGTGLTPSDALFNLSLEGAPFDDAVIAAETAGEAA